MAAAWPQADRRVRGGADAWDDGPAGLVLAEDYFPEPAPAAVGTAFVTDRTDPAWVAAVKARTRTVTSRVDLLDDTDTVIGSLPVTGGDIEYTSDAISWAARLELSGRPDLVPTSWLDPLDARSRTRARVVWAVSTPDGWLEWTVCTLDLEDPTVHETAAGITVTVDGHDPRTGSAAPGTGRRC